MRAARRVLAAEMAISATVEQAVEEFIDFKVERGFWDKRSVERTGGDLRYFARVMPKGPVAFVNPSWMRSFLKRMMDDGYALATQRSKYGAVTEFLGWCVRQRHLSENPCTFIHREEKPWVGKRAKKKMSRGKPQLRNLDESRRFLEVAANNPDIQKRVAVQLPLCCGMRSGETRHLTVGDVDFAADKIWIRDDEDQDDVDGWDVKTMAGRRTVGLPGHLAADLWALCDGRDPQERVFHSKRGVGDAYERKWLNRAVKAVCAEAGVRVVCAHGLRDTFTSIQREKGRASSGDIAEMVGHADGGKTAERHYIGAADHQPALETQSLPEPADPDSVRTAQPAVGFKVIKGGKA